MAAVERRDSQEEFLRRGDALYDQLIRPVFEPSHHGQLAAIDIETGEFEVDESEIAAGNRLRARLPNAETWMSRIGSRSLRRFGFVPRKVGS